MMSGMAIAKKTSGDRGESFNSLPNTYQERFRLIVLPPFVGG